MNTKPSVAEKAIDKYVRERLAEANAGIHIYWKLHLFTQRTFQTEGDAKTFVISTIEYLFKCDNKEARAIFSYMEDDGMIQIGEL